MKKELIYELTCCGIFAALMCIFGPLSIPVGPVPISLFTFILYLCIIILGFRGSAISLATYILLGFVGLPVFSGFSGGVTKIAGPTGGYIIGYFFLALIGASFYKRGKASKLFTGLGFVIATAVLYLFGTIWFVELTKSDVKYALSVCVLPFIIGDILKIIAAVIVGWQVRKALFKRDLIPESFSYDTKKD